MELFYAKGTVAMAVLITLYETGLPFKTTTLDFSKTEQRSLDYLSRNPKGRVPALVTENGILTETPAILPYVAGLAPDAKLLPSDPFELAQMNAFTSYLASTAHVNHAHRMRGARWADEQSSFDDMAQKVPQNMRDTFAYIQSECLRGPWVMGDQYTVADAYLFTVASWLEGDSVNVAEFPAIKAHYDAMKTREAVQKALTY